jgi:hypothetical protein
MIVLQISLPRLGGTGFLQVSSLPSVYCQKILFPDGAQARPSRDRATFYQLFSVPLEDELQRELNFAWFAKSLGQAE